MSTIPNTPMIVYQQEKSGMGTGTIILIFLLSLCFLSCVVSMIKGIIDKFKSNSNTNPSNCPDPVAGTWSVVSISGTTSSELLNQKIKIIPDNGALHYVLEYVDQNVNRMISYDRNNLVNLKGVNGDITILLPSTNYTIVIRRTSCSF